MDELRYYTQVGKVLNGGMGRVYHLRHKYRRITLGKIGVCNTVAGNFAHVGGVGFGHLFQRHSSAFAK